MPLTAGTRIGPYEIKSPLGEGGMGVVFRALDTKLHREVALKLLPDHFADDPERLARFQREAQVLASLNHPNIAQVHGLEDSTAQTCIVMELVDGETLQERLKRGPVPVNEACAIAKQICEALEASHEKGIIHRDLKPANIKLTMDGAVKVLDFGLARIREAQGAAANPSNSPTLMSAASTPGMIMGTAAYMSPEQAKGRPVDKRTDIFAFGAVLFEMLTGQPAFDGEDVADILSCVLQREPEWTKLPLEVSGAVLVLLRCCLEKDLKKRRRDIGDVRIDLEQALKEPLPSPTFAAGSRLPWILVAVSALLIAVLTIPATLHLREQPIDAREMRVDIATPQTPQPFHFALSPDGMRLVFVASGNGPQQLWLRPLDSAAAQPLAGTEGAEYPFWSPDSHSIGFFAAAKLKRIDVGIGAPQSLADAPAGRGGAWSKDGTILFAATNGSPLSRVPASGGAAPVQVTKLDLPRQGSHRLPRFLPDGRHFLFFAQGSVESQGIYLASLDGGEAKRLTAADAAGAYTDPGFLIFNNQGALLGRHLDIASGSLTGETFTLAESIAYDPSFNLAAFSVSATGRIAYRAGGLERRQLMWFDRAGRQVGVVGEIDNSVVGVDISPDGRQLAVSRTVQNNMDLWLIDALRGGAARLTSNPAVDQFGTWAPDGTQIAFTSNRNGIYDIFATASNGAGTEELLLKSSQVKAPTDWSRDGRFILFQDVDPKNSWDVWALPMFDERKPFVVVSTPSEEREAQFSPDGKWIAYQSNETGQFEIYVQPFPGPGGKIKVSTAGGKDARWRADGKELFFIAPNSKLMAVPTQTSGSRFEVGTPTMLFPTRIVSGGIAALHPQYDVSKDGRFLVNTQLEESTPITLILNWHGRLATRSLGDLP